MKIIISFRQIERLALQMSNAVLTVVIVVLVLAGSSPAQRRKAAAPAKPALKQTYSCVPFEEVKEKDFDDLLKAYPFLSQDDLPASESGDNSNKLYIADLQEKGFPRLFFIEDPQSCSAHDSCMFGVYIDQGNGFKGVDGDLIDKVSGAEVFISRDHLSLIVYQVNWPDRQADRGFFSNEWRFKNDKFQLGQFKVRLPRNLPNCTERPTWNPAAKPVAAIAGGTADTPNGSLKTPDALVAELYDPKTDDVFQAESRVPLDKYFDKEFADLIWKELLHWKYGDPDPIESFDSVLFNFGYGNGDVDNSKPIIGKPVLSDGNTQVNVTYNIYLTYPVRKYLDRETIQFYLVEGKAGWRITDIRYDGKFVWCVKGKKLSLFHLYSMDAKATAAEREYWETKTGRSIAPQDYRHHLQKFPNGAYAEAARAKLQELEK